MQRVDEQARVSDLPASATTHEAPKLILSGPSLPRRLPLEGAERSKLTLGVEDLFHGGGTECGSAHPPGLRRTRRNRALPYRRDEVEPRPLARDRRKSPSSPASQRPASLTSALRTK